MNRHVPPDVKQQPEPQAELESQFILRLPQEPARILREILRTGLPLKDRLSIKLENDLRYGEVRFDHWLLHAKVVDLPTIVEALKTIDNKSFYKTADICQGSRCDQSSVFFCKKPPGGLTMVITVNQLKTTVVKIARVGFDLEAFHCSRQSFIETDMKVGSAADTYSKIIMLICKEEDDQTTTDEDSPVRQKKKDTNKVDKKFLWPHGITPPAKNVRRRRFRKTLKKKYVEAPEIEKEVKRLLRGDNDAVNVKWEVICEDEDNTKPNKVSNSGVVKGKRDMIHSSASQSIDVAEHDIFGEAVSDSEDDDEDANINVELDDTSRLSAESRVSDSNSMQVRYTERNVQENVTCTELVTEFSKEMFHPENSNTGDDGTKIESNSPIKLTKLENFHSEYMIPDSYNESQSSSAPRDSLQSRLDTLHAELAELRQRRQQQEIEIANIENLKLRQRFQEILDNLLTQEMQKVQEIQDLQME